jgi:hypothetical protein
MSSKVYETRWHGVPALALENEHTQVVMVPTVGAKIVSLVNKHTGYEWMVGPDDRPFGPIEYGATFIDQDMSGWDEMFPTINACEYPAPGKYQGAKLPDHGEVWALPWLVEEAGDGRICLSVEGRALPYRLERTATLDENGALRLEYRATNNTGEAMPYVWAGHPQFTAEPEMTIVLPDEIGHVVNVLDLPQWGPAGTIYTWPVATRGDGKQWQLDHVAPVSAHDCRKLFIKPDQHIGWTDLREPLSGNTLRMEWPPDKLPYMGMWIDEGTYNTVPVCAPEPTTGYYDNLVLAYDNGKVSVLQPGAADQWYVLLHAFTERAA